MPKLSNLSKDIPAVTTLDGDRIQIVMRHGFTEVTYTAEVNSTSLDVSRDYSLMSPAQAKFVLDLSGVERTERQVHAEPHFVNARRHGAMCICECPRCDGSGLCACAECPCQERDDDYDDYY